ncbi:carbohydrate ABC transporter permease [Microbacterium sp. NPDC087589]|uniref:carbohydrate ABC transporter permease n=1 Tax=Microbacterium sp. NPDC087589 TaxID=3364191 RepID=UPI0037FFECBC
MAITLEAPPVAARRAIRPSRGRLRGDGFASSMFLLPIVAIFIALFAIPTGQSIYYSFTDSAGFVPTHDWVGLDNYAAVFSDPTLLAGLSFTLLYTVSTTVAITVLAIPLAIALNKRFAGRTFARSLFFFVGVPAQAIIGLIWQYIFSPLDNGAINVVLGNFGLEAVPWLADSDLARFCVIFVAVWAQVGWHATLYLAYLQAVPADLYEQAQIDGASGRQQFWAITMPELIPALVVSTFLLVTSGLKIYDLPFTMTKGGPGYSTNTITQQIILQGLSQFDVGVGSALAVLFTIACLVVVLVQLTAANALTRRFS